MLRNLLLVLSFLFSSFQPVPSRTVQPYLYLYPLPETRNLNPGTTIAVRYGTALQADDLTGAWFQVAGSMSGKHAGETLLSDDGITLLFNPDQPFALGEKVTVTVDPAAAGKSGLQGAVFSFEVRGSPAPVGTSSEFPGTLSGPAGNQGAPSPSAVHSSKTYVTLPADFPNVEVTTPANGTADGYLFMGSFSWFGADSPDKTAYLLILDNDGDPVYYQREPSKLVADFKKQPDGRLSYYDRFLEKFFVLDTAYQVVDTYQSGNGYSSTDVHELQILPNGHALLMIYDDQIMDMTSFGGPVDAVVTGLVIQELDKSKNVVFEWRSWDHFQLTDTYYSLSAAVVDYVHGNALELDQDGKLLLSSRHLSEITKIDRQTGDIIWRLSGKNNQFTFIGDPNNGFIYQHDIRRLPNGHITLFDNRTGTFPFYSRALEYQLDETAKTATLVWSYTNPLNTYAFAMGNTQRLPNGNTFIGWGSGPLTQPLPVFTNLSEVEPDGSKALELSLPAGYVSYRAFRFPWHATPIWSPTLVVQNQDAATTLYYSWNGATEVSHYLVYGSAKNNPIPTTLIADQPKTGFEDATVVPSDGTRFCYFQVKPIDFQGRPSRNSEIVPNPACFGNYPLYIPMVLGE